VLHIIRRKVNYKLSILLKEALFISEAHIKN
jgi:hypothetical protein